MPDGILASISTHTHPCFRGPQRKCQDVSLIRRQQPSVEAATGTLHGCGEDAQHLLAREEVRHNGFWAHCVGSHGDFARFNDGGHGRHTLHGVWDFAHPPVARSFTSPGRLRLA